MMGFYEIVNISTDNVYNNQTEWNRLCKTDIQKTMEIEHKGKQLKKWCTNNKGHCAALVGTGLAVAFF